MYEYYQVQIQMREMERARGANNVGGYTEVEPEYSVVPTGVSNAMRTIFGVVLGVMLTTII